MNIVLIGAVQSTEVALKKLVQHQMNLVGVFGYRADSTKHVSGFTDLESLASGSGAKFFPFKNINDQVEEIKALEPDIIFAIGLSQLVSEKILKIPTKFCIGFHPTKLPNGRGRAPLAWMILDEVKFGAATLFELQEGVDDGPILAQREFPVSEEDDVQALIDKTHDALDAALDQFLPVLKNGDIHTTAQQEELASYYGRRAPEDGVIDWSRSALEISRLVKSASPPYPGAFTYHQDEKILVYKCKVSDQLKTRGVVGRIQSVDGDGFTVMCGKELLCVQEYSSVNWQPRVGMKLGYYVESEIHELKKRIAVLEAKFSD